MACKKKTTRKSHLSRPLFTSYILSHAALHTETYTQHQQRQIHCTGFISSHAKFLWMLNTFDTQVKQYTWRE